MRSVVIVTVASTLVAIGAWIWVAQQESSSALDIGVNASTEQGEAVGSMQDPSQQNAQASDQRRYAAIEDDRPAPILTDLVSPLNTSALDWLEKTLVKNTDGVTYDRHRLVSVDLFRLLEPIKASPQFLSAAIGEQYGGTEFPDFLFQPFEDKTYRLVIRHATVQTVDGKFITALSGVSYDEKEQQGEWHLIVNEVVGEILGEIDSVDEWVTFWPGPSQEFHVVAELSQENRAAQIKEKSDW